MINKEWEDFFGIEEASDPSYIETDFNIKQKDAVAVLASCVNANGCVDLNWMCEAFSLSLLNASRCALVPFNSAVSLSILFLCSLICRCSAVS